MIKNIFFLITGIILSNTGIAAKGVETDFRNSVNAHFMKEAFSGIWSTNCLYHRHGSARYSYDLSSPQSVILKKELFRDTDCSIPEVTEFRSGRPILSDAKIDKYGRYIYALQINASEEGKGTSVKIASDQQHTMSVLDEDENWLPLTQTSGWKK